MNKAILFLLSIFLTVGCTFYNDYNPDYVSQNRVKYTAKIKGKGLLLMSKEEEKKVQLSIGKSIGNQLFAGDNEYPFGKFIKSIAFKALDGLFSEGLAFSNDFPNDGNYALVIQPHVIDANFTRKDIHWSPTIYNVMLNYRITFFNKERKKLFEKTYRLSKIGEDTKTFVHHSLSYLYHQMIFESLVEIANTAYYEYQKSISEETIRQ